MKKNQSKQHQAVTWEMTPEECAYYQAQLEKVFEPFVIEKGGAL